MKKLLTASLAAIALVGTAQVAEAAAAVVTSDTLTNANIALGAVNTTTTTTNASGRRTTSSGTIRYSQTPVQNQWQQQNIGGGATVGITTDYARTGNGSIYFNGSGSNAKADLEVRFTPILLSSLQGASYDWLRDGSSTNAGFQVPALRLILGDAAGNYSNYLIFEPVYNGVTTAQTGWQTSTITGNSTFWSNNDSINRQPGIPVCTGGGTCFDQLSDWQSANPNKYIIGLSTGIGSGWSGNFTGAVDNISFTTASGVTSYNFEAAATGNVPEPATWGMMLLGFGAVGVAARRRKAALAAA